MAAVVASSDKTYLHESLNNNAYCIRALKHVNDWQGEKLNKSKHHLENKTVFSYSSFYLIILHFRKDLGHILLLQFTVFFRACGPLNRVTFWGQF